MEFFRELARFHPATLAIEGFLDRVDKYGLFHKNHKIHTEALALFFVTALTEPELIVAILSVAVRNGFGLPSL
jgi:hypothetical protein